MKRFCWLVLLVSPFLCAEELSLSMAVQKALNANHELLSKEKHIEFLRTEKKEAFTHYLPRVNLNATYTHLDSPIDLELDPLRTLLISLETQNKLADIDLQMLMKRGFPLTGAEKEAFSPSIVSALNDAIPSMNMHLLDQDVWRATVEFVQPIWLGGKIRALNRGANLNLQEGLETFLISKQTVMEETIRIYLMNKLLEEVVAVHREAEKGIARHVNQAESLYNSGLIAKYQLLRAKVAHSDIQKNRKNAEDNLKTARSVLTTLVKAENPDALVLPTPLRFIPPTRSRDDVRASLLGRNLTLKLMDVKRGLLKTKKRADIAADLPQIYAFGRYELYKNDLSFMDPAWAIGVGVKLNLLSSGEKYFQVVADDKLLQEIGEKRKDVEDLLTKACDQLYFGADAKQNVIESFQSRIEEAEENLKLANIRFSSGLGISLEVIDANLTLQKIKVEKLQSIYEYDISWLKIHELSQSMDTYLKELEAVR